MADFVAIAQMCKNVAGLNIRRYVWNNEETKDLISKKKINFNRKLQQNAQISLRNKIFQLVLASSPTTCLYCHILTALRTCLYDLDKIIENNVNLKNQISIFNPQV